eukprot:355307-Prorocentrum_minimum.AAC.3
MFHPHREESADDAFRFPARISHRSAVAESRTASAISGLASRFPVHILHQREHVVTGEVATSCRAAPCGSAPPSSASAGGRSISRLCPGAPPSASSFTSTLDRRPSMERPTSDPTPPPARSTEPAGEPGLEARSSARLEAVPARGG